ncbi:hypothetical protein ADL15_30630 [Actinoplanes awajinensis subsp. mycoplanecinus]|uniref:Uncharacterized protein n=1 Tax=Actinoplanes awajinensis subsp. mycoplanecinus TaxID=135947 RepID=A0A117MPL8_9ACTN|nr:hypothetical protein ADL15_30630 [Actinoplanes awajinensis subsp. mycoplanecinus]
MILLAFMFGLAATTDGGGRAYVGFYGLLEIYLAPAGLVAVLILVAKKPWRQVGIGVAAGTVLGVALVAGGMLLLFQNT